MQDAESPPHLPLRRALTEWSHPDLVEAVRAEERRFTPYELGSYRQIKLSDPKEWAEPSPSRWMTGETDFTLLDVAWDALLRDFRDRLNDGQVVLDGVQTHPEREMEFRPIPGVWAADFRFDFARGVLIADKYRFASVTARRVTLADEPCIPAKKADKLRARGGRTDMKPIIEAAVREFWDEIQKMARGRAKPNWSEVARMLDKRMPAFAKKHEFSDVPQEETIRTRVSKIYARVLSEKGAMRGNAQ